MDIKQEFISRFHLQPDWLVRAPGRVNLLGEHIDYNDGPVLPLALNMDVKMAASATQDNMLTLIAGDMGEEVSFPVDNLISKKTIDAQPLPDWALYPAGVGWSLKEAGFSVSGARVTYRSDIPIGAGLSSSAAVEVAFAVLWQALGGWECDRMTLAKICQRAENEYVGVSCGLMDQFASACGVQGHVLYLDTRTLEWNPIELPKEIEIVIVDSGIRRELLTSEYNERRRSCKRAVEMLQKYLPGIRSLRDVSTVEFAAYGYYLPEVERKRAEHVVKEIARVNSAVNAIERNDLQALGALMYAGHASLRDKYEVSHPALDSLVDIARELSGCIGARLTGAGFGGCTVNLVHEKNSLDFSTKIVEKYRSQTGFQAYAYLCRASDGASATK
jgi:galactokinase